MASKNDIAHRRRPVCWCPADRAQRTAERTRYVLKDCFPQRLSVSAGEKDLGFVTQEDYNRLQDGCNNVGKLLNGLINSLKEKE